MDAIDRRLLDLVQRDCSRSNEKLGELVGASASAVHRRLRKLEASGAIRCITAMVDQNVIGRRLTFLVGLEVERKDPEYYSHLKRWLVAEDAVQQAYNVTGEHDFEIVVTAQTVEEYDAFMDDMIAANPNIRKYRTKVVLNAFKRGLFVPTIQPE